MELEILRIMKQAEGTLFSDKEIGKILDRKEYMEHPHWARPVLERMVFEQLIWKREAHYLYPTEEQQNEKRRMEAKEQARSSKPCAA